CVNRSADARNPAAANPPATWLPTTSSAANLALSHAAFGVCAWVSWLPLGGTGRAPATVKAKAAPAEGVAAEADLAGARPAAAAPGAGDAAERPGSAATMHTNAAPMTGSFVSIRRRRRIVRASHGFLPVSARRRSPETATPGPGQGGTSGLGQGGTPRLGQ